MAFAVLGEQGGFVEERDEVVFTDLALAEFFEEARCLGWGVDGDVDDLARPSGVESTVQADVPDDAGADVAW